MANLTLHAFLQELRGNIDGLVIRKIRGRYFISRKPAVDRKRKPTDEQKAFRSKFRLASAYARGVQRSPELYAFYEPFAKKRDLRVRAVAISDYFHPPTVETIDLRHYHGRIGDEITIRATDNFGVVRVEVEILDSSRRAIERGDAVKVGKGKTWRYTTTAALSAHPVTIRARAYDRPAQQGELTVTWPQPNR